MPFPFIPSSHRNEPDSDFVIQDPFGLRQAVTPVFVRDFRDGIFVGCGTSFFVTPFGHQLSAMHVITDFFNAREISIRSDVATNLIRSADARIGILHNPGIGAGVCPAGEVLYADDFVMFPVDKQKHPGAINFPASRLREVEPELDLTSWNISGLSGRKTVFLPMRVSCGSKVKKGDRVMAVGYPEIKSHRRPGAQIVTYQEVMRGSIGRVCDIDYRWESDKKIWPTIAVDVAWRSGMSGGPIFNEDGEVIGIVGQGSDVHDKTLGFSRALWLEVLPYKPSIFGHIDSQERFAKLSRLA